MRAFLPLLLLLTLPGCVVRTAADVATAPIRATGWTYDRLTVSQAEADRARGRRARKEEERRAREARKAAREQARAQRRLQQQQQQQQQPPY